MRSFFALAGAHPRGETGSWGAILGIAGLFVWIYAVIDAAGGAQKKHPGD